MCFGRLIIQNLRIPLDVHQVPPEGPLCEAVPRSVYGAAKLGLCTGRRVVGLELGGMMAVLGTQVHGCV
jgi:hypothetical protein